MTIPSHYHPLSFFSLSEYEHASLFPEDSFVWEALQQLSQYALSFPHTGIACEIPDGVFLQNAAMISIGEGTTIEPGSFIQGPCLIGKRCAIRHGAYIRGFVVMGDDCVLGHASEVKNSIFLNHSHAAHFAYIGDSILGNSVNLGAGTRCANLRFDGKEIFITGPEGEKIASQRKKMGAIIGDNAQTGCNAVLNPGTLMGKGALCYPCINAGHYIRAGEKVRDSRSLWRPHL